LSGWFELTRLNKFASEAFYYAQCRARRQSSQDRAGLKTQNSGCGREFIDTASRGCVLKALFHWGWDVNLRKNP
jgi:hypothetical protein